jgi:hypothetical protein
MEAASADDEIAGEGVWQVVEPARWRADDSAINTLLSDLSFLRAESFVDDEPKDVETGLDRPVFEVSLVVEAGEDAAPVPPLRFALGTYVGGASDRIARGRADSLFRVSQELLADLPRRVVDYRYKQLSRFEPSQARSLALSFHPPGSGGTIDVAMVRTDEGWRAKSDSDEALAAGLASRLVAELADLKAADIVAESMGSRELSALGLSPPHTTLRVWGEAGEDGQAQRLCEVHLGNEQPGKGVLAKSGESDAVYRLDSALADAIPLNYGVFVDSFASKERRVGGGPSQPLSAPESDTPTQAGDN